MATLREIVNSQVSIREAFYLATGKVAPSGKCFCPFHDNHNTPAAKVYQMKMICFGECQRGYDAYDFLRKFRPDIIDQIKTNQVYDATPSRKQRTNEPLPDFRGLTLEQIINTWKDEVSRQGRGDS